MMCDEELALALRHVGCKLTPQRLLVAAALRDAGGHITATQLAEAVQRAYPHVDISTVHRTLEALARRGLANAFHLAANEINYEWAAGEPHHQLVCRTCGDVMQVNGRPFDGVEDRLFASHGFRADLTHFAILGLCLRCQAATCGPPGGFGEPAPAGIPTEGSLAVIER